MENTKNTASEAERKKALDTIRQNIAEYGFHTYGVTGGGPHFAYTIGLSRSLGAELILAGAYFYSLDEAARIIKRIAAELRPETTRQNMNIALGTCGSFSLDEVHTSWVKELMLGVVDFYQKDDVKAFQIVPDSDHWTIDVPRLSEPWNPATEAIWHVYKPWKYPIPAMSVGVTDLAALRGEPITEVMRWEEDEWELFAGAGPDVPEEERRIVPLGVLLAWDRSLQAIVDLQVGGPGLWREGSSEWHPWGNPK
jgi:hypothetical protein